MRNLMAVSRRTLVLGFACAVFVLLAGGRARADCVVTIAGNTLGTFYHGDAVINPTQLGIAFQGTNFSTTLINQGASALVNLGGLTLNAGGPLGSGLQVGDTLQLLTNLSVNGVALQPLTLFGTVGVGLDNLTVINFAPITTNFVDIAGNVCGTFTISANSLNLLDPIALLNGLQGNITLDACGDCPGAAPVPEPATMLLLGTGLAGFAVNRRRRRRTAQATRPGGVAV